MAMFRKKRSLVSYFPFPYENKEELRKTVTRPKIFYIHVIWPEKKH